MRGRKRGKRTWQYPAYCEEIDNPRMRGRKRKTHRRKGQTGKEEIDNPRMRGRKLLNLEFAQRIA